MKTCWMCGGEVQTIKDKPYHYTESGLDNVYLYGIIQYKCTQCDEEAPEIPNLEKLHLLIAKALVCKQESLSSKEILFLRKELGLKSKEMANLLSVTPQEYSKWENDRDIISPVYDRYLRSIYVLSADSQTGKVLHDGIKFLPRVSPPKRNIAKNMLKNIEISVSEWLKTPETPLFCDISSC